MVPGSIEPFEPDAGGVYCVNTQHRGVYGANSYSMLWEGRLHTAGVTGSIPVAPTILFNDLAILRTGVTRSIEPRTL